jgi:predicted NBD/HSP70 family sugar kinase
VAIYFAVENILSKENDNKGGAVWALKVDKEHFCTAKELWENNEKKDPASGKILDKDGNYLRGMVDDEWFMVNPEPVTHRIDLQSGKFTYHTGDKPRAIDDIPRRTGERLIKLSIKNECSADIRRRLGIMNIHHASLFPSPTGVAHFVNSEWPDIARY